MKHYSRMDNIVIPSSKPAFSNYSTQEKLRMIQFTISIKTHKRTRIYKMEDQVADLLNDKSMPINSDEI